MLFAHYFFGRTLRVLISFFRTTLQALRHSREVRKNEGFLYEAEKALGMHPNTMKMEQAQELFEGAVSFVKRINNVSNPLLHKANKSACKTCHPMLKAFNIKEMFY
jgi:hypothetical protein